ncbi:MAG: hypothetical protein GXP62_18420, partial [Oligoflexia bacterium]|nr:hypothetical protein [Oligoflexia bacterium]
MNSTMIFLVLAACGDTVEPVTLPVPQAIRAVDAAGLFAWFPQDPVLSSVRLGGDPVRLEWRVDQGTWSYVEGVAGQDMAADTRYWIPAASLPGSLDTLELRLVAGQDASDITQPVTLTATADLVAPDAPLIADDILQIDLTLQADTLPPASGAIDLSLSRTDSQGDQTDPVDPDCLDGSQLDECLLADLLQAPVDDITAPLSLPGWHPVHADPATLQFTAGLWLDAVGLTGSPVRGLVAQAATVQLASMGRTLYWGDLHGHTNLSYDGCELPDQQCDQRGDYAAEDFFDNARAVGLDFVAITDHAEWERYYPDGLSGSSVDIWTEEQRIAAANDGNGLVALVGYEWTNRRDAPAESEADKYYKGAYEGGHKTVVFSDLDVPVDFRIGAPLSIDTTTKNGLSAYTVGSNPKTDDPQEFYALLDDAAAAHGNIPVLT